MKRFNKFLICAGIAGASLALSSCVDDLDLKPTDPRELTAADFSKDPEGYMNKVLADVYMQFGTHGANGDAAVDGFDGGMSTFQRAIFNLEEIPTDEADWLATDDVDFSSLQYGYVAASNKALMGTYSRLTINISLCNDFIQTVQNGYFGLNDSQKLIAEDYVRQCKVLRGACYYYMITLFGNVPYADENTPIGSVPSQRTRADVFQLVVDDLEKVSAEFPANAKPAYGFVGKDVADAFLMKLYLNAEVFTGTPMWDKCLTKAQGIIDRLKGPGFNGSGLANHYHQLFAGNNQQYAIGGTNAVNENIWIIPSGEKNLKNYANSTFLIEGLVASQGVQQTLVEPIASDYVSQEAYEAAKAAYDKAIEKAKSWETEVSVVIGGIPYSFDPAAKAHVLSKWYNVGQAGWKCMTAREQFVDKFDWTDGACTMSPDDRVSTWLTSFHGFTKTNAALDQNHYGTNGYIPIKYTNMWYDQDGNMLPLNDESKGITNGTPVCTSDCADADYAVVRLAEVYLSAAEAMLHGAGSATLALTYVNYIRQRAGLAAWTAADLTLETLQDERCRELYYENNRRTDLIRYGKWVSGYTWNWKNNVPEGANLPAHTVLYPLPSSIVTLAGYTQNQGYN